MYGEVPQGARRGLFIGRTLRAACVHNWTANGAVPPVPNVHRPRPSARGGRPRARARGAGRRESGDRTAEGRWRPDPAGEAGARPWEQRVGSLAAGPFLSVFRALQTVTRAPESARGAAGSEGDVAGADPR